jgi:N-acetylglutamate synthase-like GNAT family acetyltransferase
MTSGSRFSIRQARDYELNSIKIIVDKNKKELGFVTRPALQFSIQRSELYLAVETATKTIIGLVHYRHRRDKQTTLYSIVIEQNFRGYGIGKRLVRTLAKQARRKGQTHILLRCPEELPANEFYRACGFQCTSVEPGKKRALNIWVIRL